MDLLDKITAALAPSGLNLIGAANRARYEALVPAAYHVAPLLPDTKTIIVIGNGGGAFWAGFRQYTSVRPACLTQHSHPLDAYTAQVIEQALTPILQRSTAVYRYVYPFRFATEPLSFMHLAQASGLAAPSLLGIVIHPEYGPWLALRAAVLIDQELSASAQADGFDPCPSCTERACVFACPAGAVSLDRGWDIPACVAYRLTEHNDCQLYCHARYQCVYGRQHRYPPDELRYHQDQSLATMREYRRKITD